MDRPRALTRTPVAAAALACILHASSAGATLPCARGRQATGVPIRVPGFGPADFGVSQEACARSGMWLESRGALLVAKPDFYGSVLAGTAIRASIELWDGMWMSMFLPGLEYRYVANATVDAGTTSLSAGGLGLHAPIVRREAYELVVYGRALLPTETIFSSAQRYGFEQGMSAIVPLGKRLEATGAVSFVSLFTVIPGRVTPVWSPAASTDVVYRPSRGVGLALGAGLRPLESVDPRGEIRLYPVGPLEVKLGAMFPVAGRDRTDVAFALSAGAEAL